MKPIFPPLLVILFISGRAVIDSSPGNTGDARATQVPEVRVAIGYGVDTLSVPNREILSIWRAYLSSPPDCNSPSPSWSVEEQQRWPYPDLLCSYVYQGFSNFTVVHLAPAVGLSGDYLIRTLVSRASESGDVRPLALYSVYATREDGRWALANALPRRTRTWTRETIGRVTFTFPSTRLFDRGLAEHTSLFVDSLAQAFEVPVPSAIEYVFTDDMLDTFEAVGLEFFPLASDTVGGRAQDSNGLVLVGSSQNGEGYRHEVAHIVLNRLTGPETAPLVREGLMTWTGGSAGLDFRELMPLLARYLDGHPELTLEGVLTGPSIREGSLDVGYDGLAVLCKMVHDAAGTAGVLTLLNAGTEPEAVLSAAARVLDVPQAELDVAWRAEIADLAG